jgi:hypothetical protein
MLKIGALTLKIRTTQVMEAGELNLGLNHSKNFLNILVLALRVVVNWIGYKQTGITKSATLDGIEEQLKMSVFEASQNLWGNGLKS